MDQLRSRETRLAFQGLGLLALGIATAAGGAGLDYMANEAITAWSIISAFLATPLVYLGWKMMTAKSFDQSL